MTINRENIERGLDEIVAKRSEYHADYPDYPDYAVREMFRQSVLDHLCAWFDKHGWPEEMPFLSFIPPIEIPKSRAFAGYHIDDGEQGLWEFKQVDGKFLAVE